MDPEFLKLIKEVLEKGITFHVWPMLLGGLVASCVGAYFGAYLKKSGEQRALDEKFNHILSQLEAQTRLTETIKSEFAKELASFVENKQTESAQMVEILKNQLSRENLAIQRLSEAVAELARRIAAGNYSVCWLCWIAKYCPQELTIDHVAAYSKDMLETLSQIVGARVVLTALSSKVHTTLSPIIAKLYKLDDDVNIARALYLQSKERGTEALAKLHQASLDFDAELLKAVTNLSASFNA